MKISKIYKSFLPANGKIIAEDTPSNLVRNIDAQDAYFGSDFKFN